MRRRIPVLVICLFTLGAGGDVPVWDLPFPEHQRWDVELSERVGQEYRIEWTRDGEPLENWSELVTYSFTPAGPEYFLLLTNRMFTAIGEGCPAFDSEEITSGEQRRIYAWSDEGCGQKSAHRGITRFEYFGGGLLVLQYTQRPDRTRASFQYWKEAVMQAEPRF